MARATTVVKLKPEKDRPPVPAIRLARSDSGLGFVVGCIDKSGVADFRSESEHNDFESALKDAQLRVHQHRLPLRNETDVELAEKAPTTPTPRTKAIAPAERHKAAPSADDPAAELDRMPRLSAAFALPEIGEMLGRVDLPTLLKRSALMHRAARTGYLEDHAKRYGDSRDHAVAYSQKTHDQIQGQFADLFDQLLVQQAILYGYLEAAFARIDQLESGSKGLSYAGVWSPGEYQKGQFVTHSGALWHCNRTTHHKPGDGNDFTLAVKRGRDGKDAPNAT